MTTCPTTTAAPLAPPRLLLWVESLALLVLGFAVFTFFYHGSTQRPGDEIGLPGHDDFYHVKMAALMPQVGLLDTFPWLQYVYFRQQGDAFVSHHYGFHVLLVPFVYLSKWITGDHAAGGRWAIATFFGINLAIFNLLLRQGRVPYRWLWLMLFLLLPNQFMVRNAFIRAINPSLICMQLLLLFLLKRWYIAAGLAIVAYIHIYLGAVMYVPVVVALFAVSGVIGPKGDRHLLWQMALITFCAWVLGCVTYPYFSGMLEFLRMQVLGSGLNPDIEVGQEWRPYSDPWFVVQMCFMVLAVWVVTLCLRLRTGPHLSADELALVLVQFAFLLLTLKARRFIEYWPPLALLSAAYMARPVLAAVRAWADDWLGTAPRKGCYTHCIPAVVVGWVAAVALYCMTFFYAVREQDSPAWQQVGVVLAEWRVWVAVLGLLVLAPLTAVWITTERHLASAPTWRFAAVAVAGLCFTVGCAAVAAWFARDLPAARLVLPRWTWAALAALYVTVPPIAYAFTLRKASAPQGPERVDLVLAHGGMQTLAIGAVALGLFGMTSVQAGPTYAGVVGQLRCNWDLAAVRDLMQFMEHNSDTGDIVFTDDWDIFPLYFYHNHHNYYIVGLDPKFTQTRRPDLWTRYVKVSRGEVPARVTTEIAGPDGKRTRGPIDVALEDIRTYFKARYVITDRDHARLASKLARAPELATLVYPCTEYAACHDAPFVVFRILAPGEAPATRKAAMLPDFNGTLYLSTLNPVSVEQGWGNLETNVTVDRNRMELRGKSFRYGLGTHAPAKLLYDIPPGYDWFEATVGIDDETGGHGSVVVSVYLDGQQIFESPVLTGLSEPAVVRIPLRGAQQIMLAADATSDGQRFDHVDWAEARFVKGPSAPAPQTSPTTAPSNTSTEDH